VAAYANLGSFHHPRFVHYWEQFHYQPTTLTPAAGYYWILLLLAPIARRGVALGAVLVLNLTMHGFHLLEPDNLVRYGVLSWGLLLLFLAWLAPEALRTLRRAQLPGGALRVGRTP
jgi:hypothetical protein